MITAIQKMNITWKDLKLKMKKNKKLLGIYNYEFREKRIISI